MAFPCGRFSSTASACFDRTKCSAAGSAMTRAVLVVGGSGAFGSRLVDGLIAATDFDVVVAGRDLARATQLAEALGERGRAIQLDATAATGEMLRATGAFCVVDAAGPFQGAEYRLARAAIAAG